MMKLGTEAKRIAVFSDGTCMGLNDWIPVGGHLILVQLLVIVFYGRMLRRIIRRTGFLRQRIELFLIIGLLLLFLCVILDMLPPGLRPVLIKLVQWQPHSIYGNTWIFIHTFIVHHQSGWYLA